jgi:archaellum biogenesis ATPase FlaH
MSEKCETAFETERFENEALSFLELLHGGGSTFQMSAMGMEQPISASWKGFASGPRPIVTGWFEDHEAAVGLALDIDGNSELMARGIYISLNPVNPTLLSRSNNRLRPKIHATKDENILCYRHLLIDVDPKRPSETNSSHEEHEAALRKCREIEKVLREEGWPEPILLDSGNGAYVIHMLPDLSNTLENKDLMKRCLSALNQKFGDSEVEIDTSVFNPARLVRLPGTLNRKGDETRERPQRRVQIVSLPDEREPVPLEKLKEVAASLVGKGELGHVIRQSSFGPYDASQLDVKNYLNHYGENLKQIKKEGTSTLFILEECIFNSQHKDGEASIIRQEDGKLLYQCFHDSCQRQTWKEARKIISGDDSLNAFIIYSDTTLTDLNVVSLAEILKLPEDNTPKFMAGVSYFETPILITGPTEIGKTQFVLQLALACSSGGVLLDEWPIIGTHNVLYVQSENTLRNLQDRLRHLPHDWSGERSEAMERILVLDRGGSCRVVGSLVDGNGKPTGLANHIKERIHKLRIRVVIFDPLSSYHEADENDNSRMRRVLDVISTYICEDFQVTPVVVHHHGKAGKEMKGSYRSRGASAISDWAGAHLALTWNNIKTGLVKAEWVKCRDSTKPKPILIRRGQDGRFEKIDEDKTSAVSTKDVVRILREMDCRSESKEALVKRIKEDRNVSRGTAIKAVDLALKRNRIARENKGKGRASPIYLSED